MEENDSLLDDYVLLPNGVCRKTLWACLCCAQDGGLLSIEPLPGLQSDTLTGMHYIGVHALGCQIIKEPLFCLVENEDENTPRLSCSSGSRTEG